MPWSLEKILLAYTSYSLNATNFSLIFIWVLLAHACVLLTNSWISHSSKYYSTSLLCRIPTRSFWLVLDVYTNFIHGKLYRVWVLYIFHRDPIFWPVLTLHTHFKNTCGPLMSLKSVPFLVMAVCNCQRVWNKTLFNLIMHYHVIFYIETHLSQYILISNIDINSIHHNRCILNLIFSHLVRWLASNPRL